jgi:hypothetical protein
MSLIYLNEHAALGFADRSAHFGREYSFEYQLQEFMEIVAPVFPGVSAFGETEGVFHAFFLEQFQQVFVPFPQEVSLPYPDPEKPELLVGGVKKRAVSLLIGIPIDSIIVKLSDEIVKI